MIGPLPHVSTLSGWVSPLTWPDLPGYVFPLPFGRQHSLFGASYPPGALVRPCGWPTDLPSKCSVSHDQTPRGCPRSASLSAVGVGAPYTPGPGVRAGSFHGLPVIAHHTVLINHRPVFARDDASEGVSVRHPSDLSLAWLGGWFPAPSASLSSSRTPPLPATPVRGGTKQWTRAWVLPFTAPLNGCDVVSHVIGAPTTRQFCSCCRTTWVLLSRKPDVSDELW